MKPLQYYKKQIFIMGCLGMFPMYNRQIKKFPTEKQNVSLKHILT